MAVLITLLSLASSRSSVDEFPNLLHSVVNFHVERHLAECDSRSSRIAGNSIVHTRCAWIAALSGGQHWISESGLDQVLTDPRLATEIQHLRSVGNSGMRAARITMRLKPLI